MKFVYLMLKTYSNIVLTYYYTHMKIVTSSLKKVNKFLSTFTMFLPFIL